MSSVNARTNRRTGFTTCTYLIPRHENLLRNIELEQLGVQVVDETRNDCVDIGRDSRDDFRVVGGEVQKIGEVRYPVLQRRLDQNGIHFLSEDDRAFVLMYREVVEIYLRCCSGRTGVARGASCVGRVGRWGS